MSGWSRIMNVFRSSRVDRDIDEELQSHFDEALADGRHPGEVSRAFGSRLRTSEAAREALIAPWLDSLVADTVFGWRQILKNKTAAAAAVISLALGIGSCMAAFQLTDALFLRPLPIAHPERVYALTTDLLWEGKIDTTDQFNYQSVPLMRSTVGNQADILALSFTSAVDLTFASDQEIEHAWLQYVSGSMFADFGLQPALGRLFNASDDSTPGARPYAVISYDYWTRRFARDPGVIGRHFRVGADVLEIIGVAPRGFTGTEPGTFTDIFVPSMMYVATIDRAPNSYQVWAYRIWVIPSHGASLVAIRERLRTALHAYREQVVKSWPPERLQQEKDSFVASGIALVPASGGRSGTQGGYRLPLMIFAVLVGLVLLIACANVANLLTAQAATRSRELALRISVGAGRVRLIQLVLIESAVIAATAAGLGLAFSYWAAPFVVARVRTPNWPVRLVLFNDWRVALFAVTLTFAVTLLFGLVPALRASSIRPSHALKGDNDPHTRRRFMRGLTAAQAAFCAFVLFIAGLFISTFERMANQPTGFSPAGVLTLESASATPLPTELWDRATQRLRSSPGVESAAIADYALMSQNAKNAFIWANGHMPDGTWTNRAWLLGVSSGWFKTMRLPLLEGRDFRWNDTFSGVAIVNEKFAHRYFGSESPVGRSFEAATAVGGDFPSGRTMFQIIGVVPDARYEDMRLPAPATIYMPFQGARGIDVRGSRRNRATFLVRTRTGDPMSPASTLRREIETAVPQIRVANIITQENLVHIQMVRERVLAQLSLFFAIVALVLAAVGIYGVLNYAVVERRREIGIRIAIGAGSTDISRRLTIAPLATIAIGSAIGIALGLATERYVAGLLYQIKLGDPGLMVLPLITMFGAALLAALPPAIRAIQIDPAALLRWE
jgi:predicted permease